MVTLSTQLQISPGKQRVLQFLKCGIFMDSHMLINCVIGISIVTRTILFNQHALIL